jgi:NitT/TauT family transport system ATP-binding protein
MGLLCVTQVTKIHGEPGSPDAVTALEDVSLTIENNLFCAVLGQSGCGKTTLLNMVAGFERPNSGEITIDGRAVAKPGWQNTIIFQDYALFPWMTVAQNIGFGLEMKKVERGERRDCVRRHIELVGLRGFEDKYPNQLSGGMRQRVAIARALAVSPEILLMDEPFAALDAQNRAFMQDELVGIWQREPKTVMLVTHSIDEAIRLADRVIVLTRRPGRVKACLEVELPRPRDEDDPRYLALKKELRRLLQEEFEAS